MKKWLLLTLILGLCAPLFAEEGRCKGKGCPPPSPRPEIASGRAPVFLAGSWDEVFRRHERKVKKLVREFKRSRPGSRMAASVKKDLSKAVSRIRKDQLEMMHEFVRDFKREIRDLQHSVNADERILQRKARVMSRRGRAELKRSIKEKKEEIRYLRREVRELELELKSASRSHKRAEWVRRKTEAAIRRDGDIKVFFEKDPLFPMPEDDGDFRPHRRPRGHMHKPMHAPKPPMPPVPPAPPVPPGGGK